MSETIDHVGLVVRRCFSEARWTETEPGVRLLPVGCRVEGAGFDAVIVMTDLSPNEYDWLMMQVGPKLRPNAKIIFLDKTKAGTSVSVERELA